MPDHSNVGGFLITRRHIVDINHSTFYTGHSSLKSVREKLKWSKLLTW